MQIIPKVTFHDDFAMLHLKKTCSSDHQPLLGVLGDRALSTIENTRLSKIKKKTMRYRFKLIHIPGKDNPGSDTMSRYPVERIRAILPLIREETDDAYIAFIEEVEDSVLALTNYVCEVTALTPDILKTAVKLIKLIHC